MSVRAICELFGKGRQAFYERCGTYRKKQFEAALVLSWVAEIRADLPKVGVRKLHQMLRGQLKAHNIKMGRDKFWRLIQHHQKTIQGKPKHGRHANRTPSSFPEFWKWPNLAKGFTPNRAGQLWVSDLTYLNNGKDNFFYLSLITDAYSRKIIGFHLSKKLNSSGPMKALTMAIKERPNHSSKLIHHSDRGIQYTSTAYLGLLQEEGIKVSMTKGGAPTENAIAERVNGILKHELGLKEVFKDIFEADRAVASAIFRYNFIRTHSSCDDLTPVEAHQKSGILRKRWYRKPFEKPR